MISPVCSRWLRRCARYRPAGEVVDVSRYEVSLHARPRRGYEFSGSRCDGTGREPVAGSVAAWLDAQDANARAGVERAERAVAEAMAERDRAVAHRDAVLGWTAKQRAKGAEVSRG